MIVINETSNTHKEFVGEKMSTIGSEYTDEDLELAFNMEHVVITATINNKIVAFCLLLKPLDQYYVAYTWSEDTPEAKRAFLKGVKYLVANYPEVKFTDNSYSGEHEKTMQRAYLKIKENKWHQQQS